MRTEAGSSRPSWSPRAAISWSASSPSSPVGASGMRPNPFDRSPPEKSTGSARGASGSWKTRCVGSSDISTGRSRSSVNPIRTDLKSCSARSWRSGTAASPKPWSGSIRKPVLPSVRSGPSTFRPLASDSTSRIDRVRTRRSTRGPGGCGASSARIAAGPTDRGGGRRLKDCDARRARLAQPGPLDLEAVRRRILLDEERGPAKLRRDLLEDPGRDLEALPRAVDPHEVGRDVVGPLEDLPQRLQIRSFDDSLQEGPVLGDDVPGACDALRAALDARPQLPAILVAARAVVDRRPPFPSDDAQGDRVRTFDAVREFVLHLVPVDLHPREVRFGELHLVQVHEGEALVARPFDEADQVGLPLRDQRHLDPDGQAERPGEARGRDERAPAGAGPEAGWHMEADLVEAGGREHPDLVRIGRHRVQMGVEPRPELVLQEADVMAGGPHGVERGSARGSPARRFDRVGFLPDGLVPPDAGFVRRDDVLVHLLLGHGTVETVEGAEARDEEDHLRAVGALAAPDREGTAGESAERSFLKAHAATKGRGGIKIPHIGAGEGAGGTGRLGRGPLSGGMTRGD